MLRFIGLILLGLTVGDTAWADTTSDIADLQRQINELRQQVAKVTAPAVATVVYQPVTFGSPGACAAGGSCGAAAQTACGQADAGACGTAQAGACGAASAAPPVFTRRCGPIRRFFGRCQ